MKTGGLIVAVIVLAGLAGGLYWSNHHKPADDAVKASADVSPKILTLNETDLTKVDLKKASGDEVALARNGSGAWEIVAPKPLTADQSSVTSMLGILSSLASERVVEDKATDLQQYGLLKPSLTVDVTDKSNKEKKLLIGDDTPAGTSAYAMLEGDPHVYTIATYTKNEVNKTANDLRDKRLITLQPDKVSRVELIANNQDLEFGRDKDQWQIIKPRPLRADSAEVGDLVSKLTDAKMDLSGTDDAKKIEAAFGSGKPVGTAKVTGDSGTQQLDVRKSKDDYYAKSSVVPGVYKLSPDVGLELGKKLEDFRNKKLFDFSFEDPTKLEIYDGAKSYFLTRSGADWWSGDGKKLDSSSVQPLISDIRDLSASKFVESGFTSPSLQLTVTSSDGKRVEKVLLSKAGDNYIAKREGEPALYQVNTSSIADLQKAAGELKPADTKK
ncbi:MAG TPA: DUF4340 domain-containing protein [Terriglobales bacterium]|nr:DUF4340 domain-containing protein [Terriglobales bacterium]